MPDLPTIDPPAIVVTASRVEETVPETSASVTLIDAVRIDRLGAPLVADLLRLVPSAAIATSGPPGSQTQIRIRGAEANHTLLFVEGVRANDPAAGNEPRFELLNADVASRIEVVRGPQSALWGSEAIGGVVAVEGSLPGSAGTRALVEGGSHDSWRGAARTGMGTAERGLSIGLAGQGSDGIDAFSGEGEHDGYSNIAIRTAGRFRLTPALLIGASGFATRARSDFDGYDLVTFQRADTLDESRNRLTAGRLFAEIGKRDSSYAVASASFLSSSNRNLLDDEFLNKTWARRRTLAFEAGLRRGRHQLIVAVESERETFHARDENSFGLTNQDRSRRHDSLTLEWRGGKFGPLSADVALRHDIFSRFKDATTFRASLKADVTNGVSVSITYGEGIAQPTFFDLYGFFPGFFVGNPSLKPETSKGWEVSARLVRGNLTGAVTYFRQRLVDEIIDSPDFSTTLNASGVSRRQGAEFEVEWKIAQSFRIAANYAYLDASEQKVEGLDSEPEQRRPKHSGAIVADGEAGRWNYGLSLSYVGRHRDRRDSLPYELVDLDSYWLAGARMAYRLTNIAEASLRIANAFAGQHQDLVGYRTEGRTIHAGLRIDLGR